MPNSDEPKGTARWIMLGLVSLIFFVTTGGAFSSLGVLFESMISDLGWTYTQAGAGFTVLALMTGLSSTIPAYTIKVSGIRLTYLSGALLVGAGFILFGLSNNMFVYLLGAALIGTGYSQTGSVPAVTLLSGWFKERRSLTIGLFFTCGALGSVVGPLAARFFLNEFESWRLYWWLIGGLVIALGFVSMLVLRDRSAVQSEPEEDAAASGEPTRQDEPDQDWTLAEVLRSPQYHIIVAGLTVTLLGALTMNSWQVTHMQGLGVSGEIAAGALSAHALFNAFSRTLGGAIIDRVGAKWLYASGLATGCIGMTALAYADTPVLIGLFAFGDGYGFGIVTFASAILLLNYYGVKNNPAILGTMNLVSTIAMIGPIMAGWIGDRTGGFSGVFLGIAFLMLIVFVLAIAMPKPVRRPAKLVPSTSR